MVWEQKKLVRVLCPQPCATLLDPLSSYHTAPAHLPQLSLMAEAPPPHPLSSLTVLTAPSSFIPTSPLGQGSSASAKGCAGLSSCHLQAFASPTPPCQLSAGLSPGTTSFARAVD